MPTFPNLSALEFPGVLRNPDDPRSAIAALGGDHALRAALNTTFLTAAPVLTLNLRPGFDVSPSNITSEKPIPTTNLFLLHISIPETSPHAHTDVLTLGPQQSPTHAPSRSPSVPTAEARIVGRITSLLRFRALADFQYHPHNLPSTYPAEQPPDISVSATNELAARAVYNSLQAPPNTPPLTQNQLIDRLRPRRFARSAAEYATTDYWFRQYAMPDSTAARTRVRLVPDRPLGHDRRSDANRLDLLHHRVKMDVDKVPDGPPEEINPPAMRARAAFHELLDLMTQLFTIRPVWIRRALYDGIPARLQGPFKKVISKVAYSFQENGPFYMAWIRYGYDPRKDPSSRKFQVMEIRITNVIIQAAVLERLGEGKNADPHTTSPLGKSGGAPPRETGEVGGTQYPEPFHMPAKFTLAQLPRKRNNFVQICDISLDNIVKLCRDEPVTDTFDPKYGFFSKQGHERLSSTIKRTLLEMSKHELGEDRVTQLQKGDYSSIGQGTGRRPIRLFLKDVIKPPQGAQLPGTPTVVSEVPTSRLSNVVEPGPDRAQVISGQVQNHTPVQEVALQMTNQITPQVALQPLPVQAVDRVADLNVGSDAANQQTPEMTSEALDMEDAEGIQILEDDDDDDDEYYDDSDEDI